MSEKESNHEEKNRRKDDPDANREYMRERQMFMDRGATLGPDQRDPCHGETNALRECLKQQKQNGILTCDEFREYETNCQRFWAAVQDYRENVLKQSTLKYPQNLDTWRAKMPEFYLSGQLIPPDNVSA